MVATNSSIRTPKIPELVNTYLDSYSYVPSNRADILRTKNMLRKDTISRYCIEIIHLWMFSALGEYQHSRATIRKDIQNSISTCVGSWREILKRMCSCYWYGWSFTEVAMQDTPTKRKVLSELFTLDPSFYSFAGNNGEIKEIHVLTDTDLVISYNAGIHLVAGSDISFNHVFGCGRAEAVLPYWELQQLMLGVLAIAGQRQATPILVQQCDTDTDIQLIDDVTGEIKVDINGQPMIVKKGWIVLKKLEEMGSAGINVIDPDDKLFAVELKCDGQFILDTIKYTEYQRMLGYLVPVTLGNTSLSGIGDSGLSDVHLLVFQMMIYSMLEFLMEEIIEKLIRPLIIYNFGEQSSYGFFEIDKNDSNALDIAKVALDAVNTGKFGLDHFNTINLIRRKLSLPELDQNEFITPDA